VRADRLLTILLLLQVHGRLTSRQLAERLEVSRRTVHRDMEALSAAGVPVYALRGAGGGWVLPADFRTDLTGLHEAEVRAMFLAQPPRVLADLGLRGAAEAGLAKLLAALPAGSQPEAERMRQRIHVDATSWRGGGEPMPCLRLVQEAVWRDRRLEIGYRRAGGEVVDRVVDPLGLVAKGGAWYLLAGVEEGTRTYRVSRIARATLLDRPAHRPPGFDLAAAWEASQRRFEAELPRYRVRLRVRAERARQVWELGHWSRVEAVGEADGDGWCEASVRFQFREDAARALLPLGEAAEVIEPGEVREDMIDAATAILRRYGRANPL